MLIFAVTSNESLDDLRKAGIQIRRRQEGITWQPEAFAGPARRRSANAHPPEATLTRRRVGVVAIAIDPYGSVDPALLEGAVGRLPCRARSFSTSSAQPR